MKLVLKSADDWMPIHYAKLQNACLKYGGASVVTPMDWGFTNPAFPEPHVKMLSSAASKFRLAKLCEGLREPEKEVMQSECVGNEYFDRYSAQVLVMLSFVALEAHLRMMELDWKNFKLERVNVEVKGFANTIRDDFGSSSFTKLRDAMDNARLRARLDEFWSGSDQELLAVLSAIRNSFSHGKMGISKSISIECAEEAKTFLLSVITADCELVTRSLVEQDRSLLLT